MQKKDLIWHLMFILPMAAVLSIGLIEKGKSHILLYQVSSHIYIIVALAYIYTIVALKLQRRLLSHKHLDMSEFQTSVSWFIMIVQSFYWMCRMLMYRSWCLSLDEIVFCVGSVTFCTGLNTYVLFKVCCFGLMERINDDEDQEMTEEEQSLDEETDKEHEETDEESDEEEDLWMSEGHIYFQFVTGKKVSQKRLRKLDNGFFLSRLQGGIYNDCNALLIANRLTVSTWKYRNYIREKQCYVCLDGFEKEAKCIRLPCGHFYHDSCFEEWSKVKMTCAVCSLDIRVELLRNAIKRQRKDKR